MGHHRMPCHRKPLNHTFGVGLIAGSLTLSGAGLLLPATANADVQVDGQAESPGAAGGNRTAVNISNNTYVIGRNNTTSVNQTNQNSVGGNGNSSSGGHVFRLPDVEVGGQRNSPGAAGGRKTLVRVSNNTIVVGRNNNTAVNQSNENDTGGSGNSSTSGGSGGAMQVGGQSSSPGAAGGNTTGVDISNNTYVFGRNNTTTVNQVNQNSIGGSGNTVTPGGGGGDSTQMGGQNNSPGAAGGNSTGISFSNNTFVAGRGNTTQVTQFNGNSIAGDGNSVAPGGDNGSTAQWGGQTNSPGAAGGNRIGANLSNNTFVVGRDNATQVTQFNQNAVGGSGNTVGPAGGAPNNPLLAPLQIAGQNNSPGAAGGDSIGVNASNNTYVVGRNNTTVVNQTNQNYIGGDTNAVNMLPVVVTGVAPWWIPVQIGGQNRSPGAAGGNTGANIANNTFDFGGGNVTQVTQNNLNTEGGSNNYAGPPVVIPIPVQP